MQRALTHRSWCAENPGHESNERLEFLGDAVLGLVVSDEVFHRFADENEGRLSRLRAAVVCGPALAEMAAQLGVGDVLLLGKGEESSGGRQRHSILADALEAVIGAVYLDAGLHAASSFVLGLVADRLAAAGDLDHKSRLHELIARRSEPAALAFKVTEQGPEHDKSFHAVALVDGVPHGNGEGRSKKQAEQAAAREAWASLATIPDPSVRPVPVGQGAGSETSHG